MPFVRILLFCVAFAVSGVLVSVEHSRAHAQDAASAMDVHADHGHDHSSVGHHGDEDGAVDADPDHEQHGSSGHDADLHLVAIGLTPPATDLFRRTIAERSYGNCLNLLGPFLPRDPDPDRA